MDPTTPRNTTCPLPQSTPLKCGTATVLPFTTNQKFRIQSCTAMAAEMKSYLLGPMPPQEFLDAFFPISSLSNLSRIPNFTEGCYAKVLCSSFETLAYDPFVGLFFSNSILPIHAYFVFKIDVTRKFAPGLKFVNSSSYVDINQWSQFPFNIKPDVTCYEKNAADDRTNSATAEIFIEFKWNTTDDPFVIAKSGTCQNSNCGMEHESFLRASKGGVDTLGQITSYAAAQLGAQFRTHAYSVLIVKDIARILRWDRSGTIVMEPIQYNQSPHLAEFFQRYSVASAAWQG